jgi:hypothetical protein
MTMLDVRKWDAVLWKGHVEIIVAVRLDDAELRYPEITCGRCGGSGRVDEDRIPF